MRTKVKMLLAFFRTLGRSTTNIPYNLEKIDDDELVFQTPKGMLRMITSLKNVIFELIDENFEELYRSVHTEEYWELEVTIDPTLNQITLTPYHDVEKKVIIKRELDVTDLPQEAKRIYDKIYEGEYGTIIDFIITGHFGHRNVARVKHNGKILRFGTYDENVYFKLADSILKLIIGEYWIDDYGTYADIRLWGDDIFVYIEQEEITTEPTGFEKFITE